MANKIEIRGVVLARSIQVVRSVTGAVGYLPDIIKEVKARYGFLAAPKDEDVISSDPAKGAEFRHGRIIVGDRTIVVDRLTVFNDGVVADSTSATDETDLFLDDLAAWAKTALPKVQIVGPRYYLSQIEFGTASPLEIYVPGFRSLGEKITSTLGSYGIVAPRYEVTYIGEYYDQTGRRVPQPGAFYIDRRQNFTFGENVWFSQAPLKTDDHIMLLKRLEEI